MLKVFALKSDKIIPITGTEDKILPVVFVPMLNKQEAPLLKYEGNSANGIPFKFDKNGRNRSTKSAYKKKTNMRCRHQKFD